MGANTSPWRVPKCELSSQDPSKYVTLVGHCSYYEAHKRNDPVLSGIFQILVNVNRRYDAAQHLYEQTEMCTQILFESHIS